MTGRGTIIQSELTGAITDRLPRRSSQASLPYLLGALMLGLLIYYGGRALLLDQKGPVHLVVYAFSTQEEVLTQSIFPAFEQTWQAETGQKLTIDGVFGPSSTLAGQITLGAPADVAILSNAHHVTYLRLDRTIRDETQAQVLGATPIVIVTRPGNPLGIHDFADLARPGVRLLHASPRSSGGGEWGLLGAYGSVYLESGDQAAAAEQLHSIWRNVCLLAPSARAAMTLFELGAGDALITYEQDALLALERGVALEVVLPPSTIVAEPVVVIVDTNLQQSERPAAEAFVRYLLGEDAQQQFAHYGQRPRNGEDLAFAPVAHPFTVERLGGWPAAYRQVVQTLWQREIEPRLELEGVLQVLPPDPPSAETGRDEGEARR